jgi:hypothetical protein
MVGIPAEVPTWHLIKVRSFNVVMLWWLESQPLTIRDYVFTYFLKKIKGKAIPVTGREGP